MNERLKRCFVGLQTIWMLIFVLGFVIVPPLVSSRFRHRLMSDLPWLVVVWLSFSGATILWIHRKRRGRRGK